MYGCLVAWAGELYETQTSMHFCVKRLQEVASVKFGYYLLNTYVPELDGESPELYTHWLEQIDLAESLRF